MEALQFENELKTLSFLCGSHDSDTLFNQEYEGLLEQIKRDPDTTRRQARAARLRQVADAQLAFLTNAWLEADKETIQ
jgi:hypothetical protein